MLIDFLACFADTVYFHLPPLSGDMKCVYGVSCYRQIEAKVGDCSLKESDGWRQLGRISDRLCVCSVFASYWGLLSGPEGSKGRRHQRDGPEERLRPQSSGESRPASCSRHRTKRNEPRCSWKSDGGNIKQ